MLPLLRLLTLDTNTAGTEQGELVHGLQMWQQVDYQHGRPSN